jgi:hypothetical protein
MPPTDDQGAGGPKPRVAGPARQRGRAPALPADPATQQRAIAALFIALLSLAGLLSLNYLQRGIYLVAYALLAGLTGLWLAVTSLTRARRARTARPRGSVAATVIAAAGIVLSVIMMTAFLVLGKELAAYGRCLSAASSGTDQQACETQFIHAVNREVATLRAGR